MDSSGGTASTAGDYRGWYGHRGDGNPPSAPNATVPSSGTVGFDFSLVLGPVRTAEVCKTDTDCKMEPDGICQDEKTIVHFDCRDAGPTSNASGLDPRIVAARCARTGVSHDLTLFDYVTAQLSRAGAKTPR